MKDKDSIRHAEDGHTDSLFERAAAMRRAIASTQLLSEEIVKKADRDRSELVAEYEAVKQTANRLTNNGTTLPLEQGELRSCLLRMQEIRRCVIALDEVAGGAKYGVDTDEEQSDPGTVEESLQAV